MQIEVSGGWANRPDAQVEAVLEFHPQNALEHDRLAELLTAEKLLMVILEPAHENNVLRVRLKIADVLTAPLQKATNAEPVMPDEPVEADNEIFGSNLPAPASSDPAPPAEPQTEPKKKFLGLF